MNLDGHDISGAWRDRVFALRYIPKVAKLVWKTHRLYTASSILLRVFSSLAPVAILWVAKLIIDAIVTFRERGGGSGRLWKLFSLEIALVVGGGLLARLSTLIESLLTDLFNITASERLMAHAATLDLFHFETPAFYDRLERTRQKNSNWISLMTQLMSMGQDVLTLVSLSGALLAYNRWLLLLLGVAVVPTFFGETHFLLQEYSLFNRCATKRRQLSYLCYVGASSATAKEVQLFGLAPWIISRFGRLAEKLHDEEKRLAFRKSVVSSGLSFFSTLGYYGAYITVLVGAINGRLTIGALTFLAGSFYRARDLVERQLMTASSVLQQALYLRDMFDFFDMKPSITSRPGAITVARPITKGLVFDNVGFCYPGSDTWTLRNVNLEFHPRQRVAFVGENGAGKTTLTKLVARLYDPTEGRILLDGRDIREYDLQSLRRTIGIIFQDFVCYDWRFDENIGIGEIEGVKNYLDLSSLRKPAGRRGHSGFDDVDNIEASPVPVPGSIVSAAEKSEAATLLAGFSHGYRQMLGRRFETGIELSGGEWQKIALARAYMRDAQVLILDEPTASLDARAEYEVFIRVSRLMAGRMAIIISHRFSTVRMADRIVVLQKGMVIEEGGHDDLLSWGGLYAELFSLQAEAYR